MKKEKNNKNFIIGLLLGIIVVLIAVIILLATNNITLNFNSSDNNQNNEDIEGINEEESDDNNDIIINNKNVKEETLNNILEIIGISKTQNGISSCLNYYLSDNDYSKNYQEIITWYISIDEDIEYKDFRKDEKCSENTECFRASTSADTYGLLKSDAQEIYNLYNFTEDITGYFSEHPLYEDQYLFVSAHQLGECQYYVYHNLTAEYINSNDVKITDVQKVDEYKYGNIHTKENIINTKNQTVTYEFKQNDKGNYYLLKVDVK